MAKCVDLLLFHLHEKNLISCLFEPYSLIGFGTGGNIALYYAMQVSDTNENLRSILLFNAFSYMDQTLKDTFQSVIENFKKCPDKMRYMGDFFYESLVHSSQKSASDMKQILKSRDKDKESSENAAN